MTRTIRSGHFRVDFLSNSDRIAHVVYMAVDSDNSDGPWIELMRSIESSPEAAWPVSPPLQELHIEVREQHEVALLVGRAGKCHWSASIGFERSPDNADCAAELLVVDIACRVSGASGELVSTYQLADGISPRETAPADEAATSGFITLKSSDRHVAKLSIDSPAQIHFDLSTRRLHLLPPTVQSAAPTTIRWRFVLQKRPA